MWFLIDLIIDLISSDIEELEVKSEITKSKINKLKSQANKTTYKRIKRFQRKYQKYRSIVARIKDPMGYYVNKTLKKITPNLLLKIKKFTQFTNQLSSVARKAIISQVETAIKNKVKQNFNNKLKNLYNEKQLIDQKIKELQKRGISEINENLKKDIDIYKKEYVNLKRKIKNFEEKNDKLKQIRITGRRRLRSSWLLLGVYKLETDEEQNQKGLGKGTLMLFTKKGYSFTLINFPQTDWITMIDNPHSGTTLWDTFWYHKRNKTKYEASVINRRRRKVIKKKYYSGRIKLGSPKTISVKYIGKRKRY